MDGIIVLGRITVIEKKMFIRALHSLIGSPQGERGLFMPQEERGLFMPYYRLLDLNRARAIRVRPHSTPIYQMGSRLTPARG